MSKKVIIFFEIAAVLLTLFFAFKWIQDPRPWHEPVIVILGLVAGVAEMVKRITKPKLSTSHTKLDIDSENTLVTRFESDGSLKSGNMSLVFYGMAIVNNSDYPFTVKDVFLKYEFKSDKFSAISNVVITGTTYSSQEKKEMNALIVYCGQTNVILMGWDNLRSEIGKCNIIPIGGVLRGSAIFVLEAKSLQEVEEIKKIEIVIEDYSGNQSSHPLELQVEWIHRGENCVIIPKNFSTDKDGKIHYS